MFCIPQHIAVIVPLTYTIQEGDSDGGDRPRGTCVHLSGNENSGEQSKGESGAGSSEATFDYRTVPKLNPK